MLIEFVFWLEIFLWRRHQRSLLKLKINLLSNKYQRNELIVCPTYSEVPFGNLLVPNLINMRIPITLEDAYEDVYHTGCVYDLEIFVQFD